MELPHGPPAELHLLDGLYVGLHYLLSSREEIDFSDSGFHVIHKTEMLNTRPAHSNEGYICVAVGEPLDEPAHQTILNAGWEFEYPYYVYSMR